MSASATLGPCAHSSSSMCRTTSAKAARWRWPAAPPSPGPSPSTWPEPDGARYDHVVASQDFHVDPGAHFSAHPDYTASWPAHCVAGTAGAQFNPDWTPAGSRRSSARAQYAAAYSGFEGSSAAGDTLLAWLTERHVTDVDVAGIATDYCVRATALDAVADWSCHDRAARPDRGRQQADDGRGDRLHARGRRHRRRARRCGPSPRPPAATRRSAGSPGRPGTSSDPGSAPRPCRRARPQGCRSPRCRRSCPCRHSARTARGRHRRRRGQAGHLSSWRTSVPGRTSVLTAAKSTPGGQPAVGRRSRDQFQTGSSGNVATSARSPPWRRSTARQSPSGSAANASAGSPGSTNHAPSSISSRSWPAPHPRIRRKPASR